MRKEIPFSKVSIVGLVFSIIITSALLAITFTNGGFNLGIDFQSGQTIDILVDDTDTVTLNELLLEDFEKISVSRLGNDAENSYNIKLSSSETSQEDDLNIIVKKIEDNIGEVTVQSTAFIGTGISQNLFQSVLGLTLGALALILLYVWLRFKLQFAVSALLALLHDILFIVGIVGSLKIEVSVSTVAAILTIIGYSLNDTIVIFDRIRENIVLIREGSFKNITNTSLTQTLSRTLITSLTTLLAITALLIFATGDVYNFAKVMLIGVLEGTWSSLFIATPILTLFNTDKILLSFRSKQGGGVQYNTTENKGVAPPVVVGNSSESKSVISNSDIERIKEEVLAKRKHRKKK